MAQVSRGPQICVERDLRHVRGAWGVLCALHEPHVRGDTPRHAATGGGNRRSRSAQRTSPKGLAQRAQRAATPGLACQRVNDEMADQR